MFRPCIDLHQGCVKQIVGKGLQPDGSATVVNFSSDLPARHFAELYRRDNLRGGHVILLDQQPATLEQARAALAAWPGGFHVGGGVTPHNAGAWLDAGASHVIVTSWAFRDGRLDPERLHALLTAVGVDRLVLDLSCRRHENHYVVMAERWTRPTNLQLNESTLQQLGNHCAEFLIHATDIEGQCAGIDAQLVELLGRSSPLPVVYAGGARALEDLETVHRLGRGRVDLTIGSALDIFGGTGIRYADAVAFNQRLTPRPTP